MGKNKKNRKIDSKEVGLEIGLIFFKHFLKTEYLHYGYFTPEIEVDITNINKAQEAYADYLLSHIPEGVTDILEVGLGSGKFAQLLTSKGYNIVAVSPSKMLNGYAKEMLGDTVDVHTKKFEDFSSDKKFDLVLFSESFQYIKPDQALDNALAHLKKDGHILICDFFQTDAPGKSPLGGGHKYAGWLEVLKKYPQLDKKFEEDITKNTAPTMDLANGMTMEVLKPMWYLLFALGEDRYPRIMKFIRWKFKKKLEKMEKKHFQGERNGANFIKYKKYMTYLFQYKG